MQCSWENAGIATLEYLSLSVLGNTCNCLFLIGGLFLYTVELVSAVQRVPQLSVYIYLLLLPLPRPRTWILMQKWVSFRKGCSEICPWVRQRSQERDRALSYFKSISADWFPEFCSLLWISQTGDRWLENNFVPNTLFPCFCNTLAVGRLHPWKL